MKNILITGGAGFIGINAAQYFLDQKKSVIIFDNFSRNGSRKNIAWLKSLYPKVRVVEGDVRANAKELREEMKHADLVLHLAAQVAVTTSVEHPQEDFEINTQGTLNMLELVRLSGRNPIFIYSSTNKVYGSLEDVGVVEKKSRYEFINLEQGISEKQQLDFHSPYGCSKGAADQYVRDYARIYGLNTVVFRQSCIYGPHQFGVEDQGWLAWFMIRVLRGEPITIYGNGKQVRDVLYIDDLVAAYDMAAQRIEKTRGQIYNIGGGMSNTLSIWHEYQPILEKLFNKEVLANFAEVRPGDQPIFVSDTRKAEHDFAWTPAVSMQEGIERLYNWISSNKELFL